MQINDVDGKDLHDVATVLGIEHGALKEALSFSVLTSSDGKMMFSKWAQYLKMEVRVGKVSKFGN